MRKRIIIINSIIIVVAFLFLLCYNIFYHLQIKNNDSKDELKSYLSIASRVYNLNNEEEVIHLFDDSSKKVRVTIIDFEGNVIADTIREDITTNHLFRDEIKNLGEFVERKSPTLGINMLYLATATQAGYIRVALEVSSINQYVWNYVLVSVMTTLIILATSITVLILSMRKYLRPLSLATEKLEGITNTNNVSNKDTIEALVSSIDCASNTISLQMNYLKQEKDKVLYIMNHISQGLIIINQNDEVEMINDYTLKILELNEKNIIGKNYIYCFRDQDINEAIDDVKINNTSISIELVLNGFTYQVNINQFDNKIAILLTDITKIKNLDNTKREFFSNASHELKSPLTSIIGYQQMIKEGIITDEEEIKEATTKTIIEANRMNDIIIEMLELSKLESQISYEYEKINIQEIIDEVLISLENEIAVKNISITKKLDTSSIMGCKEHIYTLIKNIIENSIKYNKNNGKINITLKANKFEVEDTGIGIEEKNISRIFERFYRVDKAKSKELGSTGLGLAIVKHICKMYNYKIDVNSSLGIGTTFTITF